jgi:hypothetical protein
MATSDGTAGMGLGARGWLGIGVLAGALAGCQGSTPAPSESALTGAATPARASGPQVERSSPPLDWAGAGDCLGQLRLLHAAAGQGRLDESQEPPFAVLRGGPTTSLEWIQAPTVPLVADLPLESFENHAAATAAAPCLLLVEPARDVRAAHRVVDFEDVASAYQSSVRSEKNPEYDAAQARLRDAERGTGKSGPGVLRVGDPMLDLVGIVVGGVITAFGDIGEDDLDDALAELKETPRSRDRPVYRAYEFERSTVRAGKEAVIPIGLRDLRRGRTWRTQLHQREMREFAVLEGLDPRDRDYEQHRAGAMSWREFEHWQREPPQLPLSALVAALVEPGAATAGPPVTGSEPLPATAFAIAAPAHAGLAGPEEGAAGLLPLAASEPLAGPADTGSTRFTLDRRSDPGAPEPSQTGPAPPSSEPARRTGAATGLDVGDAGLDPRAASVVRLAAGDRRGSGFYVEPRLVVTTGDVVGTASVIDVTTSDGAQVLGLVVLTDPSRNLAVIHVPRAGQPAPLVDPLGSAPSRAVQVVELASEGRARVIPAVLQASSPGDARGGAGAHLELANGGVPAAGAPVFGDDGAIGLLADQSGEPGRNVVGSRELQDLLESEALAGLR